MEPQSENPNTSIYDVQIPYEVMYCPYSGSYQDMINKAYEKDDKKMMKALIEYRDVMIKRDDMIKRNNMIKSYPEHDSHVSGETVN